MAIIKKKEESTSPYSPGMQEKISTIERETGRSATELARSDEPTPKTSLDRYSGTPGRSSGRTDFYTGEQPQSMLPAQESRQGFYPEQASFVGRDVPALTSGITPPEIPKTRIVQLPNKDGSLTSYKINPDLSVISQTGQYEYDFWTSEGQKERVANALDTSSFRLSPTAINGERIPIVSEVLTGVIDVANVALIINAASGWFNLVKGMNKIGALTLGGDTTKAANMLIPTIASGTKSTTAVGKVATNTKTIASGLEILKGISTKKAIVGGLAYLIFREITGTIESAAFVESDKTNFIQSLGFHIDELRKAGMNNEADELLEMAQDLKDGLDVVVPFLPFGIGGYVERSKISKYTLELDKILDKHANLKLEETKFADDIDTRLRKGEIVSQNDLEKAARSNLYGAAATLLKNQAVAKANPNANVDINGNSVYGRVDENGNYIPSDTELAKQKWVDEVKNTDVNGNSLYGYINENGVYVPSYTELAKRLESQQYYDSLKGGTGGAGTTEYQPPSSLNFGLLRTAGGYETADKSDPNVQGQFVTDPNEIANYYFNIPYEQLTDEQKQLVDMMV